MSYKKLNILITVILITIPIIANATIINNLNGTNYEWLELTATRGFGKDAIELRIANKNDSLYGYKYASRSLLEELLLSYAPWDGVDGYYNDTETLNGFTNFLDDFGTIENRVPNGSVIGFRTLVDGTRVDIGGFSRIRATYGEQFKCHRDPSASCYFSLSLYYDANGQPVAAHQLGDLGWDSTGRGSPVIATGSSFFGNFLVKPVATVPEPSVIMLLILGILTMITIKPLCAFTKKHT